ncbi:class I SAM-dependent methyltransferase [Longitalea luteola]|uniref:class I SAM-dependent methyltransferase n=1 Tax=Longitalea luteola TaxID=2812563 RepID=UPI001A979EE8|nr:class I SAM-dependent methyltransferase [Longitalea luteola]
MSDETKDHWENVYRHKQANEVSWTQDVPQPSLHFIHSLNIPASAAIIDIGAGDSKLVDFLLDEGFQNITLLDVSEQALEKVRKRLGDKAERVKFVVADITEFTPVEKYDVWHDRATFHFLTTVEQVQQYVSIARQWVKEYLIVGTFSEKGPKKCSGLDIKQYSEKELENVFSAGFSKIRCIEQEHLTPFNTLQHFVFCGFRKSGL